MSALVSAIINNYNYGRFIGEAIESVLNQTYQNIELIIVDDGSTDNSREVIEKYTKECPDKITAVFKENGGQASAFNSGFELAKGEIICFLDSDDYWFPTKIEKVVEAHHTADIVEHSTLNNGVSCKIVDSKEEATRLMKEKSIFKVFIQTSAISYKKELLDILFPIPKEGLEICADVYVAQGSIYFSDKVHLIKETLSYYRIHGDNNWIGNEKRNAFEYDKKNFDKIISLLNQFLESKGLPCILRGERKLQYIIDNIVVEQGKKYALYGTGSVSEKVYERVSIAGGEIVFFVDTFAKDDKESKNNTNVIPLSMLKKRKIDFDYIIIASSFQKEILVNLQKAKISEQKIIGLTL